MKTLFPLPAPKRIGVTSIRLVMLDRIELGRGLPRNVNRQVLRRLIKDGLVVCVLGQPARYYLTPVGRMVRGRPRQTKTGVKHEPSRATAPIV